MKLEQNIKMQIGNKLQCDFILYIFEKLQLFYYETAEIKDNFGKYFFKQNNTYQISNLVVHAI